MPHSSGGGNHGGGFHGGSGGSGGTSHRVGNTYFPGARRYVYYDRRRRIPRYYYTNYDVSTQNPVKTSIVTFAITIPLLLLMVFAFAAADEPPSPIYDNCRYSSTIYDYADVIDNEREVLSAVNEFTDASGIKVAIVTVNNETWLSDGWFSGSKSSQLEDYAYNLYVDMFGGDEYHWLIVYSEPTNPDDSFNDWYWEGMQGDNTDPILTDVKTGTFTSKVQRCLTEGNDFGEALVSGFDKITPGLMDFYIDFENLIVCGFMSLFIFFHCYLMVFFDPDKKFRGAVELAPEQQVEVACEYCGGKYVSGSVDRCPYCGAPARVAAVDPATMPNLDTYVYSNSTPDKLASANGGYTSEYDEIFKDQFHETKLN